ncbi:PREDICTED: taste receptor type 2 member 9-like [Nanorana parkeri]|uniref:taste receptor type 2 member 9-like n=1 Tax=Nanorana parkeri TaxID=125878 RepID=UPI000854FE51|nr:PREDICTED: taste receptor type 2 member 9-like [Nanorana parkeri]
MSRLPIAVVGIHSALLVTGLTGNIFILIVHLLDWLKTREHNPCNIIINSIGTFNIFLQGAVAFQEISSVMFPKLYSQAYVAVSLVGITTSLVLSSLWCATCLCFYYCVKIVNINRPFLYKLKAKLPKVVPWLIVFSTILSWSFGMTAIWDLYLDLSFYPVNITGNVTILMFQEHGSRYATNITVGFSLIACFPTINSIILILGNRKLKNILKKILGMKSVADPIRLTLILSSVLPSGLLLTIWFQEYPESSYSHHLTASTVLHMPQALVPLSVLCFSCSTSRQELRGIASLITSGHTRCKMEKHET